MAECILAVCLACENMFLLASRTTHMSVCGAGCWPFTSLAIAYSALSERAVGDYGNISPLLRWRWHRQSGRLIYLLGVGIFPFARQRRNSTYSAVLPTGLTSLVRYLLLTYRLRELGILEP